MKLLRILYLLGNVRFIFEFDYTPYNVYTKFKNVQKKHEIYEISNDIP